MSTQETVSKLLQKRDSLTAAQCAQALGKVTARLAEIDGRLTEIDKPDGWYGIGSERKSVSESGTAVELERLDEELSALMQEQGRLHLQQEALAEQKEKSVLREVSAAAAKVLKRLQSVIKSTEITERAHAKNVTKLEALASELMQYRTFATNNSVDCPTLPQDQFKSIARLLMWDSSSRPDITKGSIRTNRFRWRVALCGRRPEDEAFKPFAENLKPSEPWPKISYLDS